MFVSSSCVKHEKIKDSIEDLAMAGFQNIELSGGTKYYEGYEDDLFILKDKYNLNYILHNYFPPPEDDFILNLASRDDEIYHKTLEHYKKAFSLCRKWGLGRFGMHAGFFLDFHLNEVGKDIAWSELYDKESSLKRFCHGYHCLQQEAQDIELYIENNVLSLNNFKVFHGRNPFMLTDYDGYKELKTRIDFNLLLDIAHLRVSANSLGLDFIDQLNKMFPLSDYVHISDNDGLHDQNFCFKERSDLLSVLKDYDFSNKIVTIETRGNISEIKASQQNISRCLAAIQ